MSKNSYPSGGSTESLLAAGIAATVAATGIGLAAGGKILDRHPKHPSPEISQIVEFGDQNVKEVELPGLGVNVRFELQPDGTVRIILPADLSKRLADQPKKSDTIHLSLRNPDGSRDDRIVDPGGQVEVVLDQHGHESSEVGFNAIADSMIAKPTPEESAKLGFVQEDSGGNVQVQDKIIIPATPQLPTGINKIT